MAKWIAARWKPILELSGEQTARFEAVALKAEKENGRGLGGGGGRPGKFREPMRPVLEDRNAAVAKILTPGQPKKHPAAMAPARRKAAEKPADSPPVRPPG